MATRAMMVMAAIVVVLGTGVGCDGEGANGAEQKTSGEASPAEEATTEPGEAQQEQAEPQEEADEPLDERKQAFRQYGHIPIIGKTTPQAVKEKFDKWEKAAEEAQADADVAAQLATVEEGAKVTILFGTWCEDCFREVPRLWAAFDQIEGEPPFEVEYIAVDEVLAAGELGQSPREITRIPTIIVEREGAEVGRIIERVERPIEAELLALLSGQKKGAISTSPAVIGPSTTPE